jgi:hypothetical protein
MGERSNALLKQIVEMPVQEVGHVLACGKAGEMQVALPEGDRQARRAASCLLVPGVGDRVLVCGPHADALYVVAVLERASDAPCQYSLGRDADISASGRLTLASDELVVRASRATTLIDQLASFGRELTASIGRAKLVGQVFESLFDRVGQFAGHSTRTVEGVDQVRSGAIDYRAERSVSLQGSEVMATAKTLMKVDGGQIHIG